MALEGLVARIESQRHEMRNGDYIRDMVKDARHAIAANAPEKSGQMSRNLRTQTGPTETAQGFIAGLGPRNKVGDEGISAPRGTIQAFLDDYPAFRFGGTGAIRKGSHHKGEGKGKGAPAPGTGAWQGLSKNAKRLLQTLRESGQYGGSEQGYATGKSPWFFPQEGSLGEWGASSEKAQIKPTRFLEKAMEEWGEDGIRRMEDELVRRTGWKRA